MLNLAKYTFLLLLFILLFIVFRTVMGILLRRKKARFRLQHKQRIHMPFGLNQALIENSRLYRHLADLLESAGFSLTVNLLALVSLLLLLFGVLLGVFYFQSQKGVLLLSVIFGSIPYCWVRMKLIHLQLKTRLDFLPAVEVFYQYYVLAGGQNIRNALQISLMENRMMYPVKPVFEQLYRNLTTNRDTEQCFRIFVMSLGHIWADYLVSILRVGVLEGNDISQPLKDLILDMRRAQRSDQAERNKLLEIRIANYTPLFFLTVFLTINFNINYESSYAFYVLNPLGRDMLLDALLLIFASFIMGIYLSMKKM